MPKCTQKCQQIFFPRSGWPTTSSKTIMSYYFHSALLSVVACCIRCLTLNSKLVLRLKNVHSTLTILQDILENDDIQLDMVFKNSLMLDLAEVSILTCIIIGYLYRGSYMRAHVLLNLLNKLGIRDKMRGLPSILSLFRNEFNKFKNTRARMLDSIYHMILR